MNTEPTNESTDKSTLDALAAQLQAEKIEEAQATARRQATEQAIVALCGVKDEGAQSHRGRDWKVTVTGVVNRRYDEAALSAVRDRISPELLSQCVRYKPEPITAGLRYLANNEPETYAVLAEALTATPGKPQVRVEFAGAQQKAA